MDHLADTDTYTQLNSGPLTSTSKLIETAINSLINNVSDNLGKKLMPKQCVSGSIQI